MPKIIYPEVYIQEVVDIVDWEKELIKAIYEDDFTVQRIIFNQLFPSWFEFI